MPTDVGSHATDHEARNNYLIDIDDAWENSREALDQAAQCLRGRTRSGSGRVRDPAGERLDHPPSGARQGVGDLQARGE